MTRLFGILALMAGLIAILLGLALRQSYQQQALLRAAVQGLRAERDMAFGAMARQNRALALLQEAGAAQAERLEAAQAQVRRRQAVTQHVMQSLQAAAVPADPELATHWGATEARRLALEWAKEPRR